MPPRDDALRSLTPPLCGTTSRGRADRVARALLGRGKPGAGAVAARGYGSPVTVLTSSSIPAGDADSHPQPGGRAARGTAARGAAGSTGPDRGSVEAVRRVALPVRRDTGRRGDLLQATAPTAGGGGDRPVGDGVRGTVCRGARSARSVDGPAWCPVVPCARGAFVGGHVFSPAR